MCGCKNSISGMARRKRRSRVGALPTAAITNTVVNTFAGTAGFALSNLLVNEVDQLKGNSFIGALVQVGLGVATVIIGKGNEMANSAGLGMAIGGGFRAFSSGMKELAGKTGVTVNSIAGLDYMMPPSVLPRLNGIGSYNGGAIVVD